MGASVGGMAGKLISAITGFGAYRVQSNSIMQDTTTIPTFMSNGDGIRIRHREFIADITGSTAFSTSILSAVCPSNSYLFPWLSQVATNFETYRFEGLVFEFRSTSEFSTSNPALGTVLMAGLYDVSKPAFTAKQALEAYEFSNSIKPNMNGVLPVECAPTQRLTPNMLVGPVPIGAAPQLYDICNLQVATQGQPSAYVVGELWVTYDIVLQKPRITNQATNWYAHVGSSVGLSTFGTLSPFTGQNYGVRAGSDLSIGQVVPTGFVFYKPGLYVVQVVLWTSANDFTGNTTYTTGGGATILTGGTLYPSVTIPFQNNANHASLQTLEITTPSTCNITTPSTITIAALPSVGGSSFSYNVQIMYLGPSGVVAA